MSFSLDRRKLLTNSVAATVAGMFGINSAAASQEGLKMVRMARDLLLPGLCGRCSGDPDVKDWNIHVDTRSNALVLKISGKRRTAVRVITESEIRSGEYKKMFVGLNTSMLEEIK